ncbi:hypothetical protein DPQ33_01285 [Oceanidesulfovibrio indonesiensis]|uniref:Hpt domain-containing protein n=1 Tax=Oceanidesulfovibrio indonesiensis TaxID=54767 RepID=A0A7M3MKD8_9BACT|nr:hypothetical protein [Oceanidesulfovibrio indonesiensis]TVM19891.1 hypothetical protein DPQ33_01285 [Oceanidesulfovibrio indonesiensis]
MSNGVDSEYGESVEAEIAALRDGDILLERFGGDRVVMREVVGEIINAICVEREAFCSAIEHCADPSAFAARVHDLASSLSPIGLPLLSRRCIEVELMFKRGEQDKARDGLAELERNLGELEEALRTVQSAQ